MSVIGKLGKYFDERVSNFTPWDNTLGFCRTSLALATLITLLFNESATVFRPIVGSPDIPSCIGVSKFSLFCLLHDNLEVARWISIGILTITIIGFYPAVTCIFHWWVTFSL
ncbi:hypothetical protein [Pseudochryseolinea flava]|uniref:Uncharacterized protein n=1 Tax=Pseudochryseolinea flava TaxID=2059302 RepID=A0A364Y8P1_9BACT|nr:hypothetical protein [Pseudochryseolinea flava]RAW03474.1 hypothetical protein DQQ10_05160 [Pseudochryseolinea flava]